MNEAETTLTAEIERNHGVLAATVGGLGGGLLGAAVSLPLALGVGALMLANPEPCTEKLCGLGEAMAAAVFGFLVFAIGTLSGMLAGCWFALKRRGYETRRRTLILLALLVVGGGIVAGNMPESVNGFVFVASTLAAPSLARLIAVRVLPAASA